MITKFKDYLNEGNVYNDYQKIQTTIINRLETDFYFSPKYDIKLLTIYPILEELCKELELSKSDIVLLTLYAFSTLIFENQNKIHHIDIRLGLEKIDNHKQTFISLLKMLYKIFNIVASKKGIKVFSFEEMINNSYIIKFNHSFLELIKEENINYKQIIDINFNFSSMNSLLNNGTIEKLIAKL